MSAWVEDEAVESLRTIVGDGETDKYVFRQSCLPTPDGVTVRFFAGDQRWVDNVAIRVNVGPSGFTEDDLADIDREAGWFELASAPAQNVDVHASYYYQWFTDANLLDFLTQAVSLLGFETVTDHAIPVGLRPAVLHWAAAKAFTSKAASYADSLSAAAPGGYGLDKKEASPNWARLAQQQFDMGKTSLQMYADNPLVSKSPALIFAAFQMRSFVPRT